jgi:hypothetical protein
MGNWSRSINEHGEYDYDWSQDEADAVVYQHEGKWKLSYSMGYDEEWQQQDLPNATSSDSAIKQADPILWTKFYDRIEKDQSVKQEPLDAWTSAPRGNGVEYQRQVSADVHAVTWQRSDGAWLLHVNDGTQLGFREHVIVDEPDVEKALGHADALIANPNYRPPQFLGLADGDLDEQVKASRDIGCEHYEEPRILPVIEDDLRTVVGIAGTVKDLAPLEQAKLDRLQQSLDQSLGGGPGWSVD